MIHEPEGLIRRQFEVLLAKDGADFFRELRRCIKLLKREPRVASIMGELRDEARELDDARAERDKQEVEALVKMRQKLVTRAPDLPDVTSRDTASSSSTTAA